MKFSYDGNISEKYDYCINSLMGGLGPFCILSLCLHRFLPAIPAFTQSLRTRQHRLTGAFKLPIAVYVCVFFCLFVHEPTVCLGYILSRVYVASYPVPGIGSSSNHNPPSVLCCVSSNR